MLLDAERAAPEQVRHHYLSRELVIGWIRAPEAARFSRWPTWPAG
ncbi:hypothetical protein AB0J21_08260 [Streptomyces sp. NPDC049954]